MSLWLTIKQYLRAILISVRRASKLRSKATLNSACKMTEYGMPGYHTFFGYHDVSPFNTEDNLLLATRCQVNTNTKAAGTTLELGVFNASLSEPVFETFAKTTTWCWQQGCRLQWYPADSNSYVFFNCSVDMKHSSCIFDIETREIVKSFDRALYALSDDGKFGISLNFARLQRLRPGYGYDDIIDVTINQPAPSDDGLWFMDLNTGESKLILSLDKIAEYKPELSMSNATHYFNHVLWSPDSKNFFFLHLWLTSDGKRHSRACIWNLETKTFSLLGPRNIVSHHCWVDNNSIIVFSHEGEGEMRYYLYDIQKGCIRGIGTDILCEDGHPSISPVHSSILVTDTYPDRVGEQTLILFDFKKESYVAVAELYSPSNFRGQSRCDLHPRWSNNGNKLCVDSAHSGERRLCIFDVNKIVESIIN